MDNIDIKAGQKHSNFWFKGKRGLIHSLMDNVYNKRENLKILNLGAGAGDDLKVLNAFGDNYVIDINEETIALIKNGFYKEKKVADACALPYPDNFFDIVVSFDVFEHIEDHQKAVSETYRVLKKGGSLVFTVPAFQFLFSSHDKALEHKRRYNKKKLKLLFRNFNNLKMNYWNFFTFLPTVFVRLMDKNSEPKVDLMRCPNFLNSLIYKVLTIENKMIKKGIPLPVGTSIVGTCKK